MPCWSILQLVPCFVNSSLRIQNLHCLGHSNRFVHEIFMTHRIEPSFGNMIFMIFVLSLWCALARQLVSLVFAFVNRFVLFSCGCGCKKISPCQCSSRILSCGFLFARHCRVHMHFQLSSRFLKVSLNSLSSGAT